MRICGESRKSFNKIDKDDLNAVAWSVLGSGVGAGATASISDNTSTAPPQRFYRIVLQ